MSSPSPSPPSAPKVLGKRARDEPDPGEVHDEPSPAPSTGTTADTTPAHIIGADVVVSAPNCGIGSDKRGLLDFLIVGAQKAGTMAAVKNLNKHPDIFVACEVHFFDLYWDMGLQWYKNHLRTNKRIVGEKTPELIYVDQCAPRIKEVCPHAKFILFLRDPVKRAYSSWNMQRSRNLEDLSFSECVSRELGQDGGSGMMGDKRVFGTAEYHYIQKGFYMDQIERFMKVFPNRDQLLIIVAERIQRDPRAEYGRIFNFLGARDFELEAEDDHVGSYAGKISKKLEKKLRDLFKPHNERLFQFLGYRIPEWEVEESAVS